MPMDMLHTRFEAHNAKLRKLWEHDRTDPGLQLTDPLDRPEWAAQFKSFCKLGDAVWNVVLILMILRTGFRSAA